MNLEIRKSSRLMIIDNQGRLLLFKYHDEHHPPFWATVGGELQEREDYLTAAQRELWEETGLKSEIGPCIAERDEIYAVARSSPARWLEKYFLVRSNNQEIIIDAWTQEESETIQEWLWWTLDEMTAAPGVCFKPEWLPSLLNKIILNDL